MTKQKTVYHQPSKIVEIYINTKNNYLKVKAEKNQLYVLLLHIQKTLPSFQQQSGGTTILFTGPVLDFMDKMRMQNY
jgi:hypothetical protein